ncbi:MAG: T9SS type A sorting domain-containing protein [Saprospiraceae bacterium]
MSPEQEIVWEYIVPLRGGQPVSQGETLTINDNLTFRMDRYPVDFPGFAGKDLSAKGWIELNPDSTFCDGILPVFNRFGSYQLSMYPNPADDMVTIEWEGGVWVDVDVIDLMGRVVIEPMRLTGGRKYLSTSHLANGMYYVRINGREAGKLLITR